MMNVKTMKLPLLLLCLLSLVTPLAQATDYTTATTGDWNLTNTWGALGKPSSAADTGLINKGAWDNAVLATTNLGVEGDWPMLTVGAGGCLAARQAVGVTGTTITNPITFDGGGGTRPGTGVRRVAT